MNGGMDWQDRVVLSGIGFVAVVFLAMVLEGIIRWALGYSFVFRHSNFRQPKEFQMTSHMQLSSRFTRNQHALRSSSALDEQQIRGVAPSIFAQAKHASRSERYTYIPTGDVLQGLRQEGFSPFMVCQTRTRDDAKREHTKHMVRLRHASQIDAVEANEIVLLNSHDGSSCYQMLAGVFRFACANGMVCGDIQSDIRIRHARRRCRPRSSLRRCVRPRYGQVPVRCNGGRPWRYRETAWPFARASSPKNIALWA
jgi:Domain of unknown function (DUF932)